MTIPAKARLAAEILWAYVAVRRSLRRADVQTVVQELRRPRKRRRAVRADPRRLGHAVARTLGVVPTDARCLMQALVLTDLLERRGVRASLVIGVAPGPDFKAHAWVEAGDDALLPSLEPAYERLVEI